MLSKKSLEILKIIFDENSNIQMAAGLAEQIIEIRCWIEKELEKTQPGEQNQEK